jgi:hypothetical protein
VFAFLADIGTDVAPRIEERLLGSETAEDAVLVDGVGELESLRAVRMPQQLSAMRQTLRVWNPLYLASGRLKSIGWWREMVGKSGRGRKSGGVALAGR